MKLLRSKSRRRSLEKWVIFSIYRAKSRFVLDLLRKRLTTLRLVSRCLNQVPDEDLVLHVIDVAMFVGDVVK
jgi:hypothetical protein